MLELKRLTMDERGKAALSYNVKHNVGRLKTTLEQTFDLELDTHTGKVTGSLHLTDLEVDSLEAAREKMATWCERMAAALRGAARKPGELPLYERRRFQLDAQPTWLQLAHAHLVNAKLTAKTDEDYAAIEDWLTGHPMVLVPGLLDDVEIELIRRQEPSNAKPD